MSWEKVRLGDVTDSCLGKMLDQAKNKGEYQPYLANVDVRWGSFDLDNLSEMRFEDDEQERYGLKYGDLVICEGGEPGRCAIWKDQIPNMKIQKALHRVRTHDCLDNRYLYYWFLLAGKTGALEQYFTGATIKHMPGQKLKSVIIDIPPIEVQRRIADILWVYDDLIENNQKQIKLLEEAVQRLYKEWFVDLRFPGHETTPITDGIPEGWRETTIGDETEVKRGGSPRPIQEYLSDEGLNWLKISDATASSSPFIYQIKEKIKPEGLKKTVFMKAGTIILSNSATPGIPKILKIDTCIHDGWLYFPNLKLSNEYMYHLFLQIRSDLVSRGTGAVFTNLRTDILKKYRFIRPADHILELFSKQVKPIFSEIDCLHQQVLLMTEARDRLLPKLMS